MSEVSRIERVTNEDGVTVPVGYEGVALDEVVAFGATVHLESLSDHATCLIIEAGGERICITIGADDGCSTVTSTLSWRERT